jgi:hypothetical protein
MKNLVLMLVAFATIFFTGSFSSGNRSNDAEARSWSNRNKSFRVKVERNRRGVSVKVNKTINRSTDRSTDCTNGSCRVKSVEKSIEVEKSINRSKCKCTKCDCFKCDCVTTNTDSVFTLTAHGKKKPAPNEQQEIRGLTKEEINDPKNIEALKQLVEDQPEEVKKDQHGHPINKELRNRHTEAKLSELPPKLFHHESEMLKITNWHRERAGLRPLSVCPRLLQQSRNHAWTMRNRRSMYHSRGGYHGENVAAGQGDAEAALRTWMNSSGHRANIMNKSFTKIGIAGYDNYWCQQFGR